MLTPYQILDYGDKPLLKWAWSVSWPFFLILPQSYIFVIRKARHFKVRVVVYTEEYECKHDILLSKEMCSESRDPFKFWETSDNISETVQDRDIVAMED